MKYYDKLNKFLDGELSDYPYFKYEIIFDENFKDVEYYTVKIKTEGSCEKEMYFMVTPIAVSVQMNEDTFEECSTYGWNSKYFWMALLSWNI